MPTVWGLIDNRAGNISQVCGIVERLGYPYELKKVHYTNSVHLPNLLRGKSLRGIHTEKSDVLEAPYPDVVVTAGRRIAPAALYIKRQHPDVFLVHSMSPGIARKDFDILALPSHDRVANNDNIIRTLGAPHHVTPEKLAEAEAALAPRIAGYPGFRIGVLLGGHAAHARMKEQDIETLLFHLQRIAGMASLLVTTSRRTPVFAADMIEAALKERPHFLYRYGVSEGENPYLGILASSDVLIVTGESISMCSEACATGKPVYIYAPERMLSAKHKRFLSMLFERGFARPLADYDPNWRPTQTLDESSRLAEIIRNKVYDSNRLSQ